MHTHCTREREKNYKQSNLTKPTMDFWWFIWLKDFYFLSFSGQEISGTITSLKNSRNFTHIIYRRLKNKSKKEARKCVEHEKGATREYNLKLNYNFIAIVRPIYFTDLFCDKYYVKVKTFLYTIVDTTEWDREAHLCNLWSL